MTFFSSYPADILHDRLLQYAALSEEAFEERRSAFCLKAVSDPEKQEDGCNHRITMRVRASLFKKEVTARKLKISLFSRENGSCMTVKFKAGLFLYLFPVSIVVTGLLLLLLAVLAANIIIQIENKFLKKLLAAIALLIVYFMIMCVPGHFIRSHIHAGNYAIDCFKNKVCAEDQGPASPASDSISAE